MFSGVWAKNKIMSLSEAYFPPLYVDGQLYEFDHLNPFQLVVPSKLARKDLVVDIKFTNHCFSYGDEDTDADEGVLFDQNGKRRLFCPDRYELSLELPGILEAMNSAPVKVRQTTARRNWSHVIQVDNDELPYDGPYYVFFELKRASREDGDDLKLTVESAYHEKEGYDPPRLLGRMGFQLLCGKVYLKQPVSTKR